MPIKNREIVSSLILLEHKKNILPRIAIILPALSNFFLPIKLASKPDTISIELTPHKKDETKRDACQFVKCVVFLSINKIPDIAPIL